MNILTIELISREIRWFVFQYQLSLFKLPDRRLFDKVATLLPLDQNGYFADQRVAKDFYKKITHENIDNYCVTLQNSSSERNLAQFIKNHQHDLLENLERILVASYFLQTCPVCGKIDISAVRTWQPFYAKCTCHTEWGEYQCGICQRKYPYIKLPFQWHLQNSNYPSVAGRDMLCTYTKDENGIPHTQCPFCH